MSAEYDAALEVKAGLYEIQMTLERMRELMYFAHVPSQRERIATAAMQGMLSAETFGFNSGNPAQLAERALLYTDALIAELNKEPK